MNYKLKLCIQIAIMSSLLLKNGCVPRRLIVNHPNLVNNFYFEPKLAKGRNLSQSDLSDKRELLKLKVQYAYYKLEQGDRFFDEDFHNGIDCYKVAFSVLKDAVNLGTENLKSKYKTFDNWVNSENDTIMFTDNDLYDLYWLGAAYGGLIKSSRGDPFEIVKLPKIGKILNSASSINHEWNDGVLHSALLAYTATRVDLSDEELLEIADKHYTIAISLSDSLDASPFVTYAESIDKKFQNRNEFLKKLDYAISIDVDKKKEIRMGNIISQDRAKWLLTKTDEYFFE
tara:strand:- start:23308 stop:24165 length:858 start_codon:yes stop_codon:yes gene_type:complete